MGFGRSAVVCALSLVLGAVVVAPLTGSAAAAATCDNAPLAGAPTVKVLVMGDSLSAGSAGDFTWRDRFWQYERARGVNIDFVGPYTGLMGTWDTPVANNQLYADPCFNQREHLAIGGKPMAATLAAITQYCPAGSVVPSYSGTEVGWATACYQPDVVLGFMGFNDLKATADHGLGATADQLLATAKTFISETQVAKPGVPVAMVTVGSTKAPLVVVDGTSYNSKLAAAITDLQGQGTPVGLVDITQNWAFAGAQTWDGYHPNANGDMDLAWDVSDGLHDLVPTIAALAQPNVAIPRQPLGPRAPGAISVSGSAATLKLGWTFPVGADREVLYRQDLTAGTGWTLVLDEKYAKDTTQSGLAPHVYQYRIRAAKGSALAETDSFGPLYSAPVTVDLREIGSVGTPQVAPSRHAVTLGWDPADTADRYLVRVRRAGTTDWSARSTSATSYPITGLVAGARYEYQVVPVRANIAGTASPVVSAVAHGTVNPAVPTPTVRSLAGQRLRISWQRAVDATRYQVRIRPAGGSWRTLGWTTATLFTSPRLVRGRTYAVAVVAWDSYVAGRTSAAARVKAR